MDQKMETELLAGRRGVADAATAAGVGRTLHMNSPDGNTFLCEMTSWPPSWKRDVKSKIHLRQSMSIYLKNTPAKFHHDPI